MQFATPSPCVRCKTKLVKPGGMTGMCKACRLADPAMVADRKASYAAMKVQMGEWMRDNFEEDPRFAPGSGYMRPKKGSKLW
jgi:hypothetical protein